MEMFEIGISDKGESRFSREVFDWDESSLLVFSWKVFRKYSYTKIWWTDWTGSRTQGWNRTTLWWMSKSNETFGKARDRQPRQHYQHGIQQSDLHQATYKCVALTGSNFCSFFAIHLPCVCHLRFQSVYNLTGWVKRIVSNRLRNFLSDFPFLYSSIHTTLRKWQPISILTSGCLVLPLSLFFGGARSHVSPTSPAWVGTPTGIISRNVSHLEMSDHVFYWDSKRKIS